MSSTTVVPTQADVNSVINNAISKGQISVQTGQSILENLDPIALDGCGGLGLDDIDSEEVMLVACIIDASYSMRGHRNAVIEAYNDHFIKPLRGAKNANDILVTTWIFNTEGPKNKWCRLLHGYTPVKDCSLLTPNDYDPQGMTPLNDAVHNAMTGIVTYGQTLRDGGTRTKCVVVVISDGEENASSKTSQTIKSISHDLLSQEMYVLAYCFLGDQNKGDAIAEEIGFPPQHRLTGQQTDSDIRRIFGTVSSSVISTSQTNISSQSLSSNAFFTSQSLPLV